MILQVYSFPLDCISVIFIDFKITRWDATILKDFVVILPEPSLAIANKGIVVQNEE